MNFDTLKKHQFSRSSISKHVDHKNGIYVYFDVEETPLYVGKSKNLKNRMKSYTAKNLAPKTQALVDNTKTFSTIEVNSELEALLLEGLLIGKLKPKYNIELKDDKHPLYIVITKEIYPRVITSRKEVRKDIKVGSLYGPFPSSFAVKTVLKTLRRIFHFSDHTLGTRACLYSQIGLCNPCPSYVELLENDELKEGLKKKYKKNINRIKMILDGNFTLLRRELVREMESYSKKLHFEKAQETKSLIAQFDYITQPVTPVDSFIENPHLLEDIRGEELRTFSDFLKECGLDISIPERIECFDIAHLAGSQPTASMVTFIHAEADKTFYRHFKIHQKKGNDDYASMREVARRRKKYLKAWGKPDLIIVDGGKGQVGSFSKSFEHDEIPIIGLAKRYETCIVPQGDGYLAKRVPKGPALNLVKRIRDESHRFARRYHHLLLKKQFLP